MEGPAPISRGNRKDPVKIRTASDAASRLRRMHDLLAHKYGPQHWWPARTPFEVVLGAYLTQNTSWKAVEVSLGNLRRARALSIPGIRQLTLEQLQELIRPSGFHTRKAPAIKSFVAMLDLEFDGALDRLAASPTQDLRIRLLKLPSVGPETADAILLYALGHAVPVADEYLRRIAIRHQLIDPVPQKNHEGYDSLVQLTRAAFADAAASEQRQFFNEFHALTVAVGKAHCGREPDCRDCPLSVDLSIKSEFSRR
jgi:endonuclease III related protein